MNDAPSPDRGKVPRDYRILLVDLSVALHRHGMYPASHPSLAPAAAAVARRAGQLLESRDQIVLGVAQRQLIVDGVATDPQDRIFRRLAEALHRHQLGAVTLSPGLDATEVAEALRLLSVEPEQGGAIGLRPAGSRPVWPHLRLHPLTFDRLTLQAEAPAAESGRARSSSRAAELWASLASAAMTAGDHELDDAVTEPSAVARAIDAQALGPGHDQLVSDHLVRIARELADASTPDAAALRQRTADVIAALDPRTLRRLMESGGNASQRRDFVRDAAQGLPVGAVLDIVRAAADAEGQTISHGLMRMLSKLAVHAERGSDEGRPLADVALRGQVGRLIEGWNLTDPNPDDYSRTLQSIADGRYGSGTPAGDDVEEPDPIRVLQMRLELGVLDSGVQRAVERAVEEGQLVTLLRTLASLGEESHQSVSSVVAAVIQPASIATLLAREPIDFVVLDQLLPWMPAVSFGPLLDTLIAASDRTTRRQLIDRLVAATVDIAPLVAERLADERWFVQRNMLSILERLGRVPEGLVVSRWTSHPDHRVRHQAVRLQLGIPSEREDAVRRAVADPDPRIVRLGLIALQENCPPPLLPLAIELAGSTRMPDDLRALAVRALAQSQAPAVLGALLERTAGGRTLFGRPRLAPPTPVMLAALRVLAEKWATHPRATVLLTLARESSDPEVRRAVQPVKS